jgi:2-polyprenyl-3-methyl-5-hydroxy-6-metoxy-1,4-benzoquinol methylase
MRTWPPLHESDLALLYSNHYPRKKVDFIALEREAKIVCEYGAAFRRWLSGTDNQGHYSASPGDKVLDIGCGSCLSLLEMRNLGINAYGVEADPNVRTIADHYNFQVHSGSVMDQPFPKEQFDWIVLNQVIEHVPDPKILLKTVLGRLKAGGKVALSFPNVDSWQRKLSGMKWINWHVPYHQHHFNLASFKRLANQQGYSVIQSRTITPNLWTFLQAYSIFFMKEEGSNANLWNTNSSYGKPPTFFKKIKNLFKVFILKILKGVVLIHNRIVDILGFGDSIFIILERKQQSE